MDNPQTILFLQQRPGKGGAQTCLLRILKHPTFRRHYHPLVVTTEAGWLTQACQRHEIPVILQPFPRSRSLKGRLWLNRRFARRLAHQLRARQPGIALVHGNDHLEGLLTRQTARTLKVPSALFVRSSSMTQRDYEKYGGRKADLITPVSPAMQQRVSAWDPSQTIHEVSDGLYPEEFSPPIARRPLAFPTRILVIGTEEPAKGWGDFVEALHQLERRGTPLTGRVDMTGPPPDPSRHDLKQERLSQTHLQFVGRDGHFREKVLTYDLVINPSRRESFGMAAMEVIAAGIPLLSSRTGVIEQVIHDQRFLFEPNNPTSLADKMAALIQQETLPESDWLAAQHRIQERFSIDRTIDALLKAYRPLCHPPP